MQHSKVTCSSCPHLATCSAQTRMFVNYCGNKNNELKDKIDAAIKDCRKQRGLILKYEVFTSISKLRERATSFIATVH